MDDGTQSHPDGRAQQPKKKRRELSDYEAVNIPKGSFETYLSTAINNDDIDAVRARLAAGANPLFPERCDGVKSALSWAAIRGQRETMQLLLKQISSLPPTSTTTEREGETEESLLRMGLRDAAAYGHALIVRDFLDWRDFDNSVNVLGVASRRWEVEVVELLLDRFTFSEEVLTSCLLQAAEEKRMIEFERTPEDKYFDSDPDKHARLVLRLLDETKVDLRDPEVGSPLLHGAIRRSEQQGGLRVLLERGADPNTRWEKGQTALHLLASYHFSDHPTLSGKASEPNQAGMSLLLQHGASITIEDDNGETPFQQAAEFSDTDIFVRYFSNLDLRATNEHGETLLHRAAAGGKYGTVEYLLSKGLDVNAITRHGWTPLLSALTVPTGRHRKTEDVAVQTSRLLLNAKADPLAKTQDGWTVLHLLGNFANPGPLKEEVPNNDPETLLELYPESEFDEEDRREMYAEDYYDPYNRTTAGTDLARELLTESPELRAMIQSPARASYQMEKLWDFTNKEYAKVPWPIHGWGRRLEESIKTAEETRVIEGMTPLHWAAERKASGVARILVEVGGADVEARDGEGARPLEAMYRALEEGDWPDEARDAIVELLGSDKGT